MRDDFGFVGGASTSLGCAVAGVLFGGSLIALGGCGSNDGNGLPPLDMTNTDAVVTLSASGTGTGTDTGTGTGETETQAATETDATASSTGAPSTNCGDLNCEAGGSCIVDDMGVPYCVCDFGYVLNSEGDSCVIDESCVQVRFLEDHCRQRVNAAPAVALFFGVDFCAGPAVTPEKLSELGLSFQVFENENDIADNVESDATIVDVSVENYVMIVLDVSDSLTESENLPDLVGEIRTMLGALEPSAGDPDVYVGVTVFARQVSEYVPFTRDFGVVDAALAALAADPTPVVELAGDGAGTRLFEATKEGIENTQRLRDLRDAVTWGGVLSTGTVVVVTDGIDSSNADLETALIKETLNQVISIGVSNDIDDEQLSAIGRDGSYLAADPENWAMAFAEITTRVQEYPERSYLLAYCSSATDGEPEVKVSMSGTNLTFVTEAVCRFDAELFSSQAFECSADLFLNECNAQQCGGLTGCGACADDQCCNGDGTCGGPQTPTDLNTDCNGQPELCDDDQACVGGACVAPIADGDPCQPGVPGCDLGQQHCDPTMLVCVDTLPLGSPCSVPSDCASLNCYFPNPENPFEGRRCLPEARIFDHCGDEDAACEVGSYCQGGTCDPRKLELVSCSGDSQCRQARCTSFDSGNFCAGPAGCYWSWDEKVP